MPWTKEDEQDLLSFKRIIDSDNIKIKEFIKKRLIDNRYIIHVLNNNELDEDSPDEYLGDNILPYYLIAPTQTNVKNFLCFDCGYNEVDRYNRMVKEMDIYFYILCHEKNGMYGGSGIARHDLLGALVMNEFNYREVPGGRMYLISDVSSVTDNSYSTRTLRFRLRTDNNAVKSKKINGEYIPMLSNKERDSIG